MIVGFNHNISYKGVGFHVQTEDSGVKTPQLVTLLYHAGTIISSKKTVYADILKVENLSQVVEDLAKEQHKGMLRSLTQGEFDERIVTLGIALAGVSVAAKPEPAITADSSSPQTPEIVAPLIETTPVEPVVEPPPEIFLAEPLVDKFRQSKERVSKEPSLDDLIFAYLSGADEC